MLLKASFYVLPQSELLPTITPLSYKISLADRCTSLANQSATTANRSALDAITIVINYHMVRMVPTTQKRKRIIEWPYGESLTSLQALLKIQEKENKRKKVPSKS